MTDVQAWLDEARTLADKTIPGPWRHGWVEDDDRYEIHGQPFDGMVCPQVAIIQSRSDGNPAFIADARTRLPQALAALQAVLDLHQPRTVYEPAGDWDGDGKYDPYCVHGDYEDHPDHLMIDGWWMCRHNPRCSEEVDGDSYPWPCPTIEAIQAAIGDTE